MEQMKRAGRDSRVAVSFQLIWRDLKYGARCLRRSPGFSIAVIFVLSIAIGANTAIFSVIQGVLLRPLPYGNAERLCVLWKSIPQKNIEWDWTSALTVRDWREQTEAFEDVATVLRPEGSRVTLATNSGSEEIQGSIVSGNFFDLLRVRPLLGRTFSPSEAQRGENVAVLSYGMWKKRFGGTSAILDKPIRIDNRSVFIIGVMPPEFQYPNKEAELWLLLTADPRWPMFQKFRIADAFNGLARLKPGRSIEEARVEMKVISSQLAKEYPATDTGLAVDVLPLFDQVAKWPVRRALWVLGGAALCVLLVACSNIASLLIARSAKRRNEIAIRAALGAGQRQLIWQLATESLLLSLAGGIGGIVIAYAGLHSLLTLVPADLPRSDEIGINGVVLGFSFGLCLLTGLVFGLLPASKIARIQAGSGLQDQGRGMSAGPGAGRIRGVLVATQYAIAIVLMTGAGLLIRSFQLLNSVNRGFETAHLLTVSVPLPFEKYKEPAHGQAFFEEAVQRLDSLPGVEGAATGSAVFDTFKGNVPNENIVVEDKPLTQDPAHHERNIVSENYFRLLAIPLQQGRLFTSEDTEGKPAVAVINRTMARHFWPSENPIGKRFKEILPGMDRNWFTVVGVVGDVVYNRDGIRLPVFYCPERQWYFTDRQVIVRTKNDPIVLIASVRQKLQSIDPTLPQFKIRTVDDMLAAQDTPRRFQTELIGIFAGIALVLAATGLYGLMAYSVEQRTKEIGIRFALGATQTTVARMVLLEGLAWGVGGIAIGVAGAIAFGRALSASLFHVAPTDPATLSAVVASLGFVMLTALLLPTLRASKIDPIAAIRHE
jgi:putative ABC transport system permease protein